MGVGERGTPGVIAEGGLDVGGGGLPGKAGGVVEENARHVEPKRNSCRAAGHKQAGRQAGESASPDHGDRTWGTGSYASWAMIIDPAPQPRRHGAPCAGDPVQHCPGSANHRDSVMTFQLAGDERGLVVTTLCGRPRMRLRRPLPTPRRFC